MSNSACKWHCRQTWIVHFQNFSIGFERYHYKSYEGWKNILLLSTESEMACLGITKDDGCKKTALFKLYDYLKGKIKLHTYNIRGGVDSKFSLYQSKYLNVHSHSFKFYCEFMAGRRKPVFDTCKWDQKCIYLFWNIDCNLILVSLQEEQI